MSEEQPVLSVAPSLLLADEDDDEDQQENKSVSDDDGTGSGSGGAIYGGPQQSSLLLLDNANEENVSSSRQAQKEQGRSEPRDPLPTPPLDLDHSGTSIVSDSQLTAVSPTSEPPTPTNTATTQQERLVQLPQQVAAPLHAASNWLPQFATPVVTPDFRPFPLALQPSRAISTTKIMPTQISPPLQQMPVGPQPQQSGPPQQVFPFFLQNFMIPLLHPASTLSMLGGNSCNGYNIANPSPHGNSLIPLAAPGIISQGGAASTLNVPMPHAMFQAAQGISKPKRANLAGTIEPFPEKLHRLLREVEIAGRTDVISFVDNNAFRIHKPELFFREIVPRYFRQSRLSSFKRQLNLYGFILILKGVAQGGYCHELFRKDEPELCRKIRRVAIKQRSSTASPPPSISDETSVVDDKDHRNDQEVSVNVFKDLDDGTDMNDASIGSTERADFLDHDESVALHDPSTMEGLYFDAHDLKAPDLF